MRIAASSRARGLLAGVASAVLVALLGACSPAQSGPARSAPDVDQVDSRVTRSQAALRQLVPRDSTPGCAAAVAERGVVLWQGAAGLADVTTRTPIGPTTRFDIASISKQFTATAVLMLAQQGRLSTADTLSKHLPDLPAWADRVTLLQLMHHVSGIPSYFGETAPAGWEKRNTSRDAVMATIASYRTLRFAPGSRWEYSNSNYFLLGVIVERVSGQPLADYFRRQVFEPVDVHLTAQPEAAVPDRATSYVFDGLRFEPVHFATYALGAARVWSTVADLAVWGDTYRTDALGGPDVRRLRQTPGPETGLESSRYAAGAFVLSTNQLYANGSFEAFKSVLVVSPDRERSAVVLCNRADGRTDVLTDSLAFIWGFR